MDQVGAGMRAEKKKARRLDAFERQPAYTPFRCSPFFGFKTKHNEKKAKNSLVGKSVLLIYITMQHMDRLSHWQFSTCLLITR